MKKLSFLLVFAFAGCTTASQKRIADFMKTPTGQAIIHIAATTGTKAIEQYSETGKVDGKEVAKAALGGASAELRKAQTPDAPITAAAAKEATLVALKDGTGVPTVSQQIAPAVAQAVANAVKNEGAPADLALEAAARGLEKAAAAAK